jgi:hypothetical protein
MLVAGSPGFVLNFSECKLAYSSAEHIPDLISSQDHRYH